MSRPAILDTFASHAFLSKLDDRCLMDLASGVVPFAASAGDYMARRGQPARAFYLVQTGMVTVGLEIESGELTPVHTVGPGGVLGWSWLIPPHRWHFSCRADGPVAGLMFDAEWLRDRCDRNHELGYHLLREMVGGLAMHLSAAWQKRTHQAQAV